METSQVGPIQASRFALGSWNTFSRMDFREVVDLVESAMNMGINLFDIAYYPDAPHSEVVFGCVLQETGRPRDSFFVQEKLWLAKYPEVSLRTQLERSLDRLQLDYVDVLMSEYPNERAPLEALTDEIGELIESGLARSWGAMNWSPRDLLAATERCQANGQAGPTMLQVKYSVARRHVVDNEYDQVLADTGVALQPSDSLEGGILAGVAQPDRPIGQDPGDIRGEILENLPKLKEIAASVNATPAQLSLAFVLANRHTATVLFGARRVSTVEENIGALDLLNRVGAETIREITEPLASAGHRPDTPGGYRVGTTVAGGAS